MRRERRECPARERCLARDKASLARSFSASNGYQQARQHERGDRPGIQCQCHRTSLPPRLSHTRCPVVSIGRKRGAERPSPTISCLSWERSLHSACAPVETTEVTCDSLAGSRLDMSLRSELARILQQEDINFLLTNRIPRRLVTRFLGWFSKIENPVVARASIAVWRLFADLDLSDARLQSFREPACLLHARAEAGRALGRCRSAGAREPVRCHRRRLRGGRRHPGASGQGFPVHAAGPAGRSGVDRGLPRWPVRDAPAHLEHVPPVSCARMTARSST